MISKILTKANYLRLTRKLKYLPSNKAYIVTYPWQQPRQRAKQSKLCTTIKITTEVNGILWSLS